MIPLFKFNIEGCSMEPAFKNGDTVLVNRMSYFFKKPKVGDAVVLKEKKYIIKRIAKMRDNKYYVLGDNKKRSTDSRNFGWIDKRRVVGKVMFKI